jgi:pilus assembly protein CpaF
MNDSNDVWSMIGKLSNKSGINEIIINSLDNIYIERDGELIRLDAKISKLGLKIFCQDVATFNRVEFNKEKPILDGSLPDGSRINIISSAYTGKTPAVTIRRFNMSKNKLDDDKDVFMLGKKGIEFFKALVASRQNIIISGGTGTGKTTLLNFLLQELPMNERVVTIEDTRELYTPIPNSINLMSKNTSSNIENPLQTRDLVKNTLRMRPDRIIIGEVRGAEAFDLIQAMNTGHNGCMCSVHANNPADALSRLENLFYFSGFDIPLKAVRQQMSRSIDFVIQLEKTREGKRVV